MNESYSLQKKKKANKNTQFETQSNGLATKINPSNGSYIKLTRFSVIVVERVNYELVFLARCQTLAKLIDARPLVSNVRCVHFLISFILRGWGVKLWQAASLQYGMGPNVD